MHPPPLGMALIRVGVGALLLDQARRALAVGVDAHLIEDAADRIALAPRALSWFGQHVLLQAPGLFAWLLVGGSALAGGAYFVGALVRPASLGVLLLAAFHLAYGPPHVRPFAVLLGLCALGCGLAGAGGRLGLDGTFGAAWPNWLTWSSAKRSRR